MVTLTLDVASNVSGTDVEVCVFPRDGGEVATAFLIGFFTPGFRDATDVDGFLYTEREFLEAVCLPLPQLSSNNVVSRKNRFLYIRDD